MLFIMQAKADGRPVEHAALYSILHTCKDGSTVNEVVQEKMVSNPLQILSLCMEKFFYSICNFYNCRCCEKSNWEFFWWLAA